MKFPMRLKYKGRGRVLATLYRHKDGRPGFTLYYRTGQKKERKTVFKEFPNYSAAKKAADRVVDDLHDLRNPGQLAVLTPVQVADAAEAVKRLRELKVATGKEASLNQAASGYSQAVGKLHKAGRGDLNLWDVVDGFLKNSAAVQRVDLGKAVDDFVAAKASKTRAAEGERSEVVRGYASQRAGMLGKFAGMFKNVAVCDVRKEMLDEFFKRLPTLPSKSRNRRPATSAKSLNHHRAAIRQFFGWCVKKDYLSPSHRLLEAEGMERQPDNEADIEFYTPAEFAALLSAAKGPMRAMVAIGGLAGLRTAELLRLDWEDVWRVENHIEVTAKKAKTRQRRLVEIVPALAQWLAPYAERTGRVWTMDDITYQQHFNALCSKARVKVKGKKPAAVKRKVNGLRHSYCTYHMAAFSNENATAMQAGNSPQMLFAHYRGLARKAEGEAWFAVAPEQPKNVTTGVKFGAVAEK